MKSSPKTPAAPRDETGFFGRTEELAELRSRLARGARLVTLVGLGGIGKTRLAMEAARADAGATAFVSIGDARALEAAVRALATAFGVRVAAESKSATAAEAIGRALASRGPLLLVLDGVDGLGASSRPLVDALLDHAPGLALVVTAREPLGVRGEEKLVLAPLDAASAEALLVDRARVAAGKPLEIDEEHASAIVTRVDRLPLAIELAASRLDVMTPEELLSRLASRLDLLSDPSRQETMRATLDASWESLSHDERELLAQASVFAAA